MPQIAMISYNKFIDDAPNGWQADGDNRILLLQGAERSVLSDSIGEQIRRATSIVRSLKDQFLEALPTIDSVVCYVGLNGSRSAINLMTQNGLPSARAVFVLCDCDQEEKLKLIRQRGFAASRVIDCRCGGYDVMEAIYRTFLATGSLPA